MASGGEKHNVRLSKSLSWLLRHHLDLVLEISDKKEIDASGFVDVADVLRLPRFAGYSVQHVEKVVEINDKQRFALRKDPQSGNLQIRANQGHTVKEVNPDLKKIEDPDAELPNSTTVIHGTYSKFWPQIREKGLSRMNRNHIHFAKGLPENHKHKKVISGMRRDCDVHIYVHLPTAIKAGFEFFESANGVILCPGDQQGFLPTNLFSKVVQRKKGKEHPLKIDQLD